MEETRFRLKLNFFDLGIVLLLLAAVLGAYFIIRGSADRESTVTYVAALEYLDREWSGTIVPGQHLVDAEQNTDMGVITAVEEIPATFYVEDTENLRMRETPMDTQIHILLTVETEATASERGVYTNGGVNLRVGTMASCTVGGAPVTARFRAVSRLEGT